MADHPCLTFSRAPLLTLDDATTFSGAPVPPLRDPRTGRVSAAAAELRSAASDRPEDDLPGMLPYQFPTRSSGSFLSGLFGSHYIAHGGPSSGICVGTAELYRAVLSGIMIVDRLNSLPPSRNGGTLNVELGGHLLWMLARLQAIPAAAKTELHGAGLLWASSGFADYLCALWDDFYADAATYGSDSLADSFIVQRCAAAVAGLERVSPPFSADATKAQARFADSLLCVLHKTNADSTRPPVPLVSGSTNLNGRLTRFSTELSALLSLAGPGSSVAPWATKRLRALRGGDSPPSSEAVELVSEVLRRPGLSNPEHTGAKLLATPSQEWPEWMIRRAGLEP